MRPLRSAREGSTVGQSELDDIGVIRRRRTVDPPIIHWSLGVGLDKRDLIGRPDGQLEVAEGSSSMGKMGRSSRIQATLWRCRRSAAVQSLEDRRRKRIPHELVHDAFLRSISGDGQHEVGSPWCRARLPVSLVETDNLWNQHRHGWPQHGGFGFDSPIAPTEHPQNLTMVGWCANRVRPEGVQDRRTFNS